MNREIDREQAMDFVRKYRLLGEIKRIERAGLSPEERTRQLWALITWR